MSARAVRVTPALSRGDPGTIEDLHKLTLQPSPLRPNCRADERIFAWKGVNRPPPSTIDNVIIARIAERAARSSLKDTASYGAGLRKFHLFCDIFSVPESSRLPASSEVLHSFALWASTDPDPSDLVFADGTPFEPISVRTTRAYLAAVRAWHIAQGWPPPLSKEHHELINFSLRGLANLEGSKRTRPPRPPVTLSMLVALRKTLVLDDPFDACVWAAAACAFWGLMRFGEVARKSASEGCARVAGAPLKRYLQRKDIIWGVDLDGKAYVRLELPEAKTSEPGKPQFVFIVEQKDSELCPLQALLNLARAVPASEADPMFSWRDRKGDVRPLVRDPALLRINSILKAWGWGTAFGHSFRIGGASFYLAAGVSPEVVRIDGRWRSLAYETYIRSFEQVASRHLGGLASRFTPSTPSSVRLPPAPSA